MLTIRAHHLLCVLGFRGYGYSEDFIENLTKISKEVKKKSTVIKIISQKDDVCKYCPNSATKCKEDIEPKSIDELVLLKLKIRSGSVLKSEAIYAKVIKNIEVNDLDNICSSCTWLEKGWCKQGLKELKNKLAV